MQNLTVRVQEELRSRVVVMLASVPIPDGSTTVIEDAQFYKHWQVRGPNPASGLFATYSDQDDVIQLALLERTGETTVNTLTATLGFEEDRVTLNVSSEADPLLNFDGVLLPQKVRKLERVVDAFKVWIDAV